MLIRKNTKAFKTIQEIIRTCHDRPDREKLIRLYITKAGHSIEDRINVEGIQGDAELFYDLNYNAVLSNLESSDRQLQQSDDIPGIYFFHRTSNKGWDETPFEFDEAIKKEFDELPDLPTVRKKEKAEKFVFPAPVKSETSSKKTESGTKKKERVSTKKVRKVIEKGPRQPDYKLKHKIGFTDLEKVIFRNPQILKKDVLEYYDKISDYILPYLKDRPLSIRTLSKEGRMTEYKTVEDLADRVDFPDWVQTAGSKKERTFLCNDKSHLLYYVEVGGIEFGSRSTRTKTPASPDYINVKLDCDSDFKRTIDGALQARTVLTGLQLPAYVKTDGRSGFDIYLPLDGKGKFDVVGRAAEYICKLIRLKVPELFTLKGSDDSRYGKVTLDFLINEESGIVSAPYSLIAGEAPTVATPLLWEELSEGFQLEDFNEDTIFKRLRQHGDPFETLFRKKINAEDLLDRMDDNYAFLF